MIATRRAQSVLAGVVALQLVAETALTPYWPMLFRRLFGLEELAATGSFLAACRVAGLAALPLWGLAALRWPVRTLLVTGLLGCAVCDLALALAPTWWSFTAFSAAVVACGSVLVLGYPALVAVVEQGGKAGRRTAVVTFWVVFHTAAIASTLIGAAIVALPQPRWGLGAFAVVDVALALLVLARVPAEPPSRTSADPPDGEPAEPKPAEPKAAEPKAAEPKAAESRPAVPMPTGSKPAAGERWRQLRPWLVLVIAVVAVDAALAVPRPFLVELLVRHGVDATIAGWLFLAPAVASLAVLPVASRLHDLLGRHCAPLAAVTAGAGLLAQAAATEAPWWFLAGRLLFGAGVGVLLVVLDLAVFDRIGTAGAAFSAVETGRSAALLAAPLLATAAAGAWLGAPLLAGAVLLAIAALLLVRSTSAVADVRHESQETEHVLDPVH